MLASFATQITPKRRVNQNGRLIVPAISKLNKIAQRYNYFSKPTNIFDFFQRNNTKIACLLGFSYVFCGYSLPY